MSNTLSVGSRIVVHGFIERLGSSKSNVAIQLDGGGVFRSHLKIGLVQSRLTKAGQSAVDKRLSESETPVLPQDSQILDRADRALIHDPLDRSDITVGAGDQPGCPGEESRLASDLAHETPTAVPIAQTGEHIRINFADEAAVLYLGVLLQERLVPWHPDESPRH